MGVKKNWLRFAVLVVVLMGAFAPMVASAALPSEYPIRPGVKLNVPTSWGVKTVSLGGLTRDEAKAKLLVYTYKRNPGPIVVKDRGISYKISFTGIAMGPTVTNMLALASTTASDTARTIPYVTPELKQTITSKIAYWASSRYKRTFTVTLGNGARVSRFGGYNIDRARTVSRVVSSFNKYGTSSATSFSSVTAVTANPLPIMTNNHGRVLVVSKTQRRVYLFSGNSVLKSYGIAIGMAAYPTPTGSFTILRKVVNPTWVNPGSAWAADMPASLSGASSPLGVRALYLYKYGKDTGIRFHGTYNDASIGTAASHGCMRMHNWDVKDMYDRVPLYTKVYIYN